MSIYLRVFGPETRQFALTAFGRMGYFCLGNDGNLQLYFSSLTSTFAFNRPSPGAKLPQTRRRTPFVTGWASTQPFSTGPSSTRGRLLRLHHGPHLRAAVRAHQQSRIRLAKPSIFTREPTSLDPKSPVTASRLGRNVLDSPGTRDAVTEAQEILKRPPTLLPPVDPSAAPRIYFTFAKGLGDLSAASASPRSPARPSSSIKKKSIVRILRHRIRTMATRLYRCATRWTKAEAVLRGILER